MSLIQAAFSWREGANKTTVKGAESGGSTTILKSRCPNTCPEPLASTHAKQTIRCEYKNVSDSCFHRVLVRWLMCVQIQNFISGTWYFSGKGKPLLSSEVHKEAEVSGLLGTRIPVSYSLPVLFFFISIIYRMPTLSNSIPFFSVCHWKSPYHETNSVNCEFPKFATPTSFNHRLNDSTELFIYKWLQGVYSQHLPCLLKQLVLATSR